MIIRRFFSNLANNYATLNIDIVRGRDIHLWDKYGTRYIDMMAAFSTVNQGHCHPKIIDATKKQLDELTVVSRTVRNNILEKWATTITNRFDYSSVLPMSSGSEAVEVAIKLSRKHGIENMSIRNPHLCVLTGNYHGKTIGAISLSDNEVYRNGFGPFVENVVKVQINNLNSLYAAFDYYGNQISAILYEPIQGEGGIVPISEEFMLEMNKIRMEHPGLLLIADEIQSGLGRSGGWTAGEIVFPNIRKPDVLLLGKSLTGGVVPMSCVLGDRNVMDVFLPGSHGSTYGGNPLAAAASISAMEVLEMECMGKSIVNSKILEDGLRRIISDTEHQLRGSGMFWGIEFRDGVLAENIRQQLLLKRYITMTARNNVLRITPPLTISAFEIEKFLECLSEILDRK